MRKQLVAGLVVATTLAGCATIRESRVNPFNWFGRSQTVVVASEPTETAVNPLIPKRRSILSRAPEPPYAGSLVQEVTELHVRRVPNGAVVEVTGVMKSINAYDVRLVLEEDDDPAVLTYSFRALQPSSGLNAGTAYARTVTAATRLTQQQLAGVTVIRVVAEGNERSVRR